MTGIKIFMIKYKYVIVFIIGVIFADLYIAGNFNGELYWDASDYWACGSLFGYDRLNFRGWYHPFRGYLTSFIWYGIQRFSMMVNYYSSTIFCFFMAFLHALISMVLIPDIMKRIFGVGLNCAGRILLCFCVMYFYKGLLIYPLSDYLAFSLFVISLYLLSHAKDMKNKWMKAVFLLCSGITGGGAYYARPVYLATVVVFCIGTLIMFARKRKIQYFVFVLGGLVLVAIPQIISNHTYHQTISPIIKTEYKGGSDLFLQQLSWGLSIQRYESTVDDNVEKFPVGSLEFVSARGKDALDKENIKEFDSYLEYVGFVLKHFLTIVLIYMKHLFNGMDIVYNGIYIHNIYMNRFPLQIVNYILCFIGLRGAIEATIKKRWKLEELFLMVMWWLPVLLAIPTAVESRFFINLNVLLYYFGCGKISLINNIRRETVKKQIKYLIGISIFVLFCFYLNWTTFSSVGIPLW